VLYCTLSSRSLSVIQSLQAMHRWILLSLIVLLSACGADTRGKKPVVPVELPDVPTLMSQRGKVLVNETFSTPDWSKSLGTYKAETELSEGHLRIAPQADAGHAPQLNLMAPMTNLVVQVRFRLDGAQSTNVQVSDPKRKENLAAVGVDAKRIGMSRITGWGRTTRFSNVANTPLLGDPAAWHTLVVEWSGNECLVQLDERVVLYGEAEQFGMAKGQLSFNTTKGSVWYDDLRVWEGVPDPAWAKRKAEVIKTLPH
jgi:hypothetical protein